MCRKSTNYPSDPFSRETSSVFLERQGLKLYSLAAFQEKIASVIDSQLNINAAQRWTEAYDQRDYFYFSLFLTPEDFIQHPEWLIKYDDAVMKLLTEAVQKKQTTTHGQQERITQFGSTPLAQVIEQLQINPSQYSSADLQIVAADAAERIAEAPEISTTLSPQAEQQVRLIIGGMLEERLAALQMAPDRRLISTPSPAIETQIQQVAQGNPIVESLIARFLRRSRDPEKVTKAMLELAGVVPGIQQIQAILQAMNTMLGPDEQR